MERKLVCYITGLLVRRHYDYFCCEMVLYNKAKCWYNFWPSSTLQRTLIMLVLIKQFMKSCCICWSTDQHDYLRCQIGVLGNEFFIIFYIDRLISSAGVTILFQELISVLTKVWIISSRGGRGELHKGSDYLISFLTRGERLHKGRDYLIFFLTSRYYWILSSQAGFAYIELTEKSVIILRLHNQSFSISSIYQIFFHFLKLSSDRLIGLRSAYIQNIYPRYSDISTYQMGNIEIMQII